MEQQLTIGLMIGDPGLNAQLLPVLDRLPAHVVMELPDVRTAQETRIDREVRRFNPGVVLLEVSAAGNRLPDVIQAIKSRSSPPIVITIHTSTDPESLLWAFRAGANDCLCLPVDDAAYRQFFARIAAERDRRAPRRPPAKTVGFLSATGGCGCTMLACHFASELWRASGQNTLLADFDLTAGMVSFWMHTPNEYSVWDVMRSWQRLDASMWRGLVSTAQPQLEVLAAPAEVVADEGCEPDQLLRVVQFARRQYDWVIADLGAGLTPFSLRLLGELGALYVVSTAELPVLYQAKRILRKLVSLGCPQQRVRLVLNGVRKHHLRPAEVADALSWQVDAVLPYVPDEIGDAHTDGRLASRRSDLGKRIAHLVKNFQSLPLEEPEGPPMPFPALPQPVTALARMSRAG